jgi:hypothetical protein
MAKRRESPNWETVERLLRIAARLAALTELIRRIF